MKHYLHFQLIFILSAFVQYVSAQEQVKKPTFAEMRQQEFSKLLGGVQEGIGLNYNNEKTTIDGSGSFKLNNNSILQLKGSVGTTTNLSELFDQKNLPTFSGSLTYHFLIAGFLSRWYYAGGYHELKSLYNSEINTGGFQDPRYTLRKNTIDGIIAAKSEDTVYTFKKFAWISITGKYENTKYNFFDATKIFDAQFYEPLYRSWNFKASFNNYLSWNKQQLKWKFRPNFIYFNISAQYGLGNNIQKLRKSTIQDVSTSGLNGAVTRQNVKSQTVYAGIYQEYKTFTPAFELVVSPFPSIAVNVFGDYNGLSKSDQSKYNLSSDQSIATGLYFYASKINIGAYYKWTMDNGTKDTQGFVGLKTSIPITPNQ